MAFSDDQIKTVALAAHLVDEKQIGEALTYAQTAGRSLQTALVEKEMVDDETLGKAVAAAAKIPFISLGKLQIPEDLFRIVPQRVARKFKVIAFARSPQGVSLAMADPTRTDIVELVAKKTNQKVAIFYATPKDIDSTLALYKKDLQKTVDSLIKEDVGAGPPLAKIVDSIIEFAYYDKASDIHIEPREKDAVVRFRIDGVLQDVLTLSMPLHDRMITRVKVLSDLRTDEHLSAQDGKMQMRFEEEALDIRVSIIPIADGEKVVMRLLSSHTHQYSLADLGMNQKDLEIVTKAYTRSFGMILSTGPTGSGKTTTIYSMLRVLNQRDRNITTIEDPIEYRIKGANQIQVNVKTNLTFANGLRSILRQDPNIIFVGEIRDSETAGIAVNAALTGHLVFSTLHTNDAATAIPRLIDMKVEPFLVASTVNVIIAQRLVRRICDTCRTKVAVTEEALLKSFPDTLVKKYFSHPSKEREMVVYQGKGCKICRETGYLGRLGLYEVLEVSKGVRELITQRADADIIEQQAVKEGMTTILEDGIDKIAKGLTTIEEVVRVTKTEMA